MDIGKAIAVLLTNPGPALKYRGFNKAKKRHFQSLQSPLLQEQVVKLLRMRLSLMIEQK